MTAGRCLTAIFVFVVPAAIHGPARGDTIVHFWLSSGDTGPVVPTIYAAPGTIGEIEVWVRPAMGHRLSAFSLDLRTGQPDIVSLESVVVLNPLVSAMPPRYRHQLVFDSDTGLFASPDELYGFLGFSFFDDAPGLENGAGLGPECGDCSMTGGAPSWHVATVSFAAGPAPGTTELFLSIGEQGVWQSPGGGGEPSDPGETSVVFGLANDAVNQWAPLGAGVDDRHDPVGLPDALIRIATADFNDDGTVDGTDFLIWQRGVGVGTSLGEGDADGDGDVDEEDLAAWRFQFGLETGAALAVRSVPEPVGLSGMGAFVLVPLARRIILRSRPR